MKFSEYSIADDIKKNLRRLGFERPTDIQYKSIPSILRGEDVMAIAQTGTGKTAAFAIPLINKIHNYKRSKRAVGIKCLVLVPTRELALQIGSVFNSLGKNTKVNTFTLHGGIEQNNQIKRLQDGIDVLVATPGRMFDLINQEYINIEYIDTLVLDEADHMLDLGFIEDIKYVKKMLKGRHQTLFFSATINKEIKKLAYSQVKSSAIRIQISPKDLVSRNVNHSVMFVEMDDKRFFLEKIIKDNPEGKLIVFVRTRIRADRVQKAMERVGITAQTLHGEKDQTERINIMKAFRNNEFPVLIATDITARGIDIPDVDIVINYDLPEKPENYVHRVGRTGRAFNKGDAISFCAKDEKDLLDEIQGFLNSEIHIIHVGKREYRNVVEQTLTPSEDVLNDQTSIEALEDLISDFENEQKQSKKRKKRK